MDDAFDKTKNSDPVRLKTEDGVDVLLSFLSEKYEPRENLRIGQDRDEFLEQLHRKAGEEIRDFDTRFEVALNTMETFCGPITPQIKAHYFLKKLNLPGDKQISVVTGAGNRMEYEALRDSAITAIPKVSVSCNRRRSVLGSRQRPQLPRPKGARAATPRTRRASTRSTRAGLRRSCRRSGRTARSSGRTSQVTSDRRS